MSNSSSGRRLRRETAVFSAVAVSRAQPRTDNLETAAATNTTPSVDARPQPPL